MKMDFSAEQRENADSPNTFNRESDSNATVATFLHRPKQ
jgi:hypothetical protein